jgi:antimicrobial peptide system SdpA family protein
MPEGWAFFTRNAREKKREMFREVDGTVVPSNQSDTRGLNLWSPSRAQRLVGIELAILDPKIPKSAWVPCETQVERCVEKVLSGGDPVVLEVVMNRPAFCGRVILRDVKPVPWSWRNSKQPVKMPSQLALLDVKCKAPDA